MNIIKASDTAANETSFHDDTLAETYTVEQLTEIFGFAPSKGDEYKVTAEWVFRLEGVVGTVYDYKGDRWHIGAKSKKDSAFIAKKLNDLLRGC